MAGKFEVYQDAAGKYRLRLKDGAGEIVATSPISQKFATSEEAMARCDEVQRAAAGAEIVEV